MSLSYHRNFHSPNPSLALVIKGDDDAGDRTEHLSDLRKQPDSFVHCSDKEQADDNNDGIKGKNATKQYESQPFSETEFDRWSANATAHIFPRL
jgi:hypothetical protein